MLTDIFLSVSFAILLFIVLLSVSAWIASRPLYAAWLVLGLLLLEAAQLKPTTFDAGILIYPEDIFFLLLSIACFIRLTLTVSPKTVPGAWWVIGILQFTLFIWGLNTFGKPAGVDYREHFYVWVAVAYFASVEWTETMISRVANALVLCSILLCSIVYFRWTASAIDPVYAQKIVALDPTGVRYRVIGSGPALMIALSILILIFKMAMSRLSMIQRLLLPLLFLTVVVLQHRSVWVALFAGVGCLIWKLQRRTHGRKTIVGILLMVVPLVFSFAIPDVLDSVNSSAHKAISTQEGTMVARVSNWQELLAKWAESKDPVTYLVGRPYGGGYNATDSEDGKMTIDMVPHNHLVHVLYRGGLVGLAATLYIFYRLWVAGIAALKVTNKPWAPYFLALFAFLFTYYIPYWMAFAHGILIGAAISYLGVARIRRMHTYPQTFEQPEVEARNP